jgi:putative ubiquitin-RnfH superfamily antitoxin RatB of RatAB toxin-antitoxin module
LKNLAKKLNYMECLLGIWKHLQKLSRQWRVENYIKIVQELISS